MSYVFMVMVPKVPESPEPQRFEKPSLEQKGYEVLQKLQKHTWFGDPYSTLRPLFDMQFCFKIIKAHHF